MRADRLLAILLLLQRGDRMTAGELARRLEVSERTIYRDLEALGAAGVPVYAEPGRGGGVRLLPGYRTDLTGLSGNEAELLPLLGLADAFSALGVGPSLHRTEAKLLAALPPESRKRAERARKLVYVDLARWWDHAEDSPHLGTVAGAVLSGRRLELHYKRGGDGSESRRVLDPLGLAVQGGVWYLVASPAGEPPSPRIYRISRVLAVDVFEEDADIPADFDLPRFWRDRKEEFHMTRPGYRVRVRGRARVLRGLRHGLESGLREHAGDGWVEAELSFGTRAMAMEHLLGLGPHVEVLDPSDLREAVALQIEQMGALYRADHHTV
jgi:predicted DNA-binding transcriptional regulator YafY